MSTRIKDIDDRARRTRNRIAAAVVALATRQPLDTVTVRQLVQEAGISRSAFYAHFASLRDYLTRSYAWMLEGGAELSALQPGGDAQALPVRAILDHMAARADYVAATRDSLYRPAMMAAGEERLRLIAARNLQRLRGDLPEAERQALAVFIAGGFMATVRAWTAAGMKESPDAVQARFEQLSARLVSAQPTTRDRPARFHAGR